MAMIVAACGGGTTAESTTTVDDQTETTLAATTTTAAPAPAAPDAQRLTYNLEPGSSTQYEVTLDQSIDMTAEGDAAAMGEEEMPGEMSIDLVGTTTFTHSVAEGPEPGTFEITIVGDFSDLEITGTVDGESIADEIPDFATMDPVEHTIVVDESGHPIGDDSGEFDDLFGGLDGMGGFGDLSGMAGIEFSHVGPEFPEEEVTVGDSWSEIIEVPGMSEDDSITTEINSTVTGTDTVDGAEVLVIETQSVTSAIEFDLAEFLLGFMFAFAPEGTEGSADLEGLEDLRFLFSIDETTTDLTTWFDAEEGVARQAEYNGGTHLVMDINMPDEESGEMVGFKVDMSVDQTVGYRLVGGPTA